MHPAKTRLPRDLNALFALADSRIAANRPTQAAEILLHAAAQHPNSIEARYRCAAYLLDTDRAIEALPHAAFLHAANPSDRAPAIMLATACSRTGDYAKAAALNRAMLDAAPDDAGLWLAYGAALRHAGEREPAAAALRRCIALAPETGAAYLALEDMKRGSLTNGDLAALQAQLARRDLPIITQSHLHYALGRALEHRGEYEASFQHYKTGAKLRRLTLYYNKADTTRHVAHSIALFTPQFIAERRGTGHPDPAPIFILGMPRAGSTLLEQILSSHPQVEATMELPELAHVVRVLVDQVAGGDSEQFPGCIANASADTFSRMGKLFIDRVRPYRREPGRAHVIDKMPMSWVHAGLIHLMLPNAKIIDARRDPVATCFSAFRQDFGEGQRFSYDFEELAQYYRDYERLMAHFDKVLPGRLYRVQYERLVEDLDGEIRRLLDHCGLDFEPACLQFWRNDRAVGTASSDQVRRPLYREGIDSWRQFEPWLGPLMAALRLGK
jgi:tetratricopeptide (TPR) repeat protein